MGSIVFVNQIKTVISRFSFFPLFPEYGQEINDELNGYDYQDQVQLPVVIF